MVSKNPKMSKQGAAGKMRHINFNDYSETLGTRRLESDEIGCVTAA
jgi:hypothetical protein